MKLAAPYACDAPGCPKVKGEANRWWLVWEVVAIAGMPDMISVSPWNKNCDKDSYQHACSESCALKLVSAWMAKAEQPKQEGAAG